ncbi:SHOCT domain-containing protein [Nocardia stercoris]|nr:SHOCT domain-containing protein [Nocardia stercoris]
MGGWGYALMTIGMIGFWSLVLAGFVLLLRSTGASVSGQRPVPHRPTPQQILAERYARGEIDDDEYTRRTRALNSTT